MDPRITTTSGQGHQPGHARVLGSVVRDRALVAPAADGVLAPPSWQYDARQVCLHGAIVSNFGSNAVVGQMSSTTKRTTRLLGAAT